MADKRKELITMTLSVCITILISFIFMLTNIQTKAIETDLGLIIIMQVVSLFFYVMVEEIIKRQTKIKEIRNKKAMISLSIIMLFMTLLNI